MAEFFEKFFLDGTPGDIIAKWLMIAVITAMYFVVFYYAKKRNLGMLTALICIALALLFVISFFEVPHFELFVMLVLIIISVGSLLLFAQDFRRDLFRKSSHKRHSIMEQVNPEEMGREELQASVEEIIKACQRLSKTDTGALILVADNISESILDSGTTVNAKISSDLLRTLFFPKTPLHDGAVVIMNNRVVAAGCYLPLTQEDIYPREFGTRHRAAIGVSEAFPSLVAIVVSEETGIISAMHDRKIKRYLDAEQLREILYCVMGLSDDGEEERIWGWTIDEKA